MTEGIWYGIYVALIIIIIWILWALLVYRWSLDRITGLIMSKYQAEHAEELKENTIFIPQNVMHASDNSHVALNVVTKNTETGQILKTDPVSYDIVSSCTDYDLKCIAV